MEIRRSPYKSLSDWDLCKFSILSRSVLMQLRRAVISLYGSTNTCYSLPAKLRGFRILLKVDAKSILIKEAPSSLHTNLLSAMWNLTGNGHSVPCTHIFYCVCMFVSEFFSMWHLGEKRRLLASHSNCELHGCPLRNTIYPADPVYTLPSIHPIDSF